MEIINFRTEKVGHLYRFWSDEDLKGTINGGSLEITFTVPLKWRGPWTLVDTYLDESGIGLTGREGFRLTTGITGERIAIWGEENSRILAVTPNGRAGLWLHSRVPKVGLNVPDPPPTPPVLNLFSLGLYKGRLLNFK